MDTKILNSGEFVTALLHKLSNSGYGVNPIPALAAMVDERDAARDASKTAPPPSAEAPGA